MPDGSTGLCVVVLSFPLLPLLFAWVNFMVWMFRLGRRLGSSSREFSAEVYMPDEPKAQMIIIGLIMAGLGVLLAKTGQGLLLEAGVVLLAMPMLAPIAFVLLRAIHSVDRHPSGVALQEQYRQKIRLISERLEGMADKGSLLALYRRYWRIAHSTDLLNECLGQVRAISPAEVARIDEDLKYLEDRQISDHWLYGNVCGEREFFKRILELDDERKREMQEAETCTVQPSGRKALDEGHIRESGTETIAIECPDCGHRFRRRTSSVGKEKNCPKCKSLFIVSPPRMSEPGHTSQAPAEKPVVRADRQPAEAPTQGEDMEKPIEKRAVAAGPATCPSIEVRCPCCGHDFRRPASLAGRRERCPRCRKVFVIKDSTIIERRK